MDFFGFNNGINYDYLFEARVLSPGESPAAPKTHLGTGSVRANGTSALAGVSEWAFKLMRFKCLFVIA
ncbi:hypothetical protein [Bradyrhizobium sp. NAS80.1]|uniref:hypothetical protein n=1 Tax=Bradyrhizobium sp. NAS80.1 TaxID=1680159 RepID=UPI001161318B|nr:hypothetical protein [Bradyrhizobium sp. NAS80.1]